MFSTKEVNLTKIVAFSQWDRIVMTMVLTCVMPFLFHAVPVFAGSELGMRWLPMFYAPLIASLYFRAHVSLIVGICAPVINHALFGMPDGRALPGLIFELVVFNAIVAFISRRQRVRGIDIVLIFILVRWGSLLISFSSWETFLAQASRSLLVAWPGMIMLAVLAEIVGRLIPRKDL